MGGPKKKRQTTAQPLALPDNAESHELVVIEGRLQALFGKLNLKPFLVGSAWFHSLNAFN